MGKNYTDDYIIKNESSVEDSKAENYVKNCILVMDFIKGNFDNPKLIVVAKRHNGKNIYTLRNRANYSTR